MHLETLDTCGFVTVEYPSALRLRVQEVVQSWKNFCGLPLKEKLKLSGGDRINDFGYMLRRDEGANCDNKELFHVKRSQLPQLRVLARTIRDSRATAFIDAIDVLLQEIRPLILAFARGIESRYGLVGLAQEVMAASDQWVFRYLHYFGGEILAHPHADRGGGFTLHLYESHGGGEYLGFDGEWHPWVLNEKQTIIFPSMGLQYRSCCLLKALWHRVLSTPETLSEGRWAMVAFIDFLESHRFPLRSQDMSPGFNYEQSFEEFGGLFVPRESLLVDS